MPTPHMLVGPVAELLSLQTAGCQPTTPTGLILTSLVRCLQAM